MTAPGGGQGDQGDVGCGGVHEEYREELGFCAHFSSFEYVGGWNYCAFELFELNSDAS